MSLATGCAGIAGVMGDERSTAIADGPVGCVFDSLPVLAATSDAVILGTVRSTAEPGGIESAPSPTEDDHESELELRWREVVVEVDRTFHGDDLGPSVTIEQAGYEGDTPYEYHSQPWLFRGDQAILFLQEDTDTGRYRVMLVGAWTVGDDGVVSTFDNDPALAAVDGESVENVAAQLDSAAADVASGEVEPLYIPNSDPPGQRCG